jgi:DNA-binding beta-propeller fold protein YncE
MAKHIWHIFMLAAMLAFAAQAQPADCNTSAASPSVTIALPSSPFTAVPSHDGCWVFVSLTSPAAGIAVLKRGAGVIELSRVVPLASAPTGIALTHDGKLLIAAASDAVVFLDVQRLTSGAADPVLGSLSDGPNAESIYANVTADDKLLFVSEERMQSITVIDLERARASGYKADAIKGKIPTGLAPIALTFSPDGKWLYTTSQLAPPTWSWPAACKPEGQPAGSPIVNPEGAVVVVDVALAATDPAKSVAARIPAGCSPVRMAISPAGDRIYVTARNSNAVVAFDTAKLLSDSDHARLGMAPVGSAPVPVAVVDGGRKVVAGNSNRFAGTTSGESLNVLDATKIKGDADAGLGVIPAGSFPREMRVSADGHTLFLTNFGSNSLQVISVDHLMDAAGPAQAQKPAAPGPALAQNPAAPGPAQTQKAPAGNAAGDPAAADMAAAAEDTKNAGVASGYVTQLAGAGDMGATRLAASRAASTADTAAAAAETAAATVESDASQATAASTAGDRAAVNNARDKAASDYSALLAADDQLARAATDLAAASAGNVAFYGGATIGAGAINDMGAQDSSAAASLLAAVTKGGSAGYSAAAANEATAIKDANAIANLAPPRAPAFQAAAKAEAEAQSAATAAAAGGSASAAAAALAAAATAGATADGPGNPYAGAVEIGAAAVANAASATISAQHAMERLKTLK